jgi:hypothetical protein
MLMGAGASADLIAYEGFDMALNEGDGINGAAGATSFGWAGPFQVVGTYIAPEFVPESLARSGINLKTRGGSAIVYEKAGADARVVRYFSDTIGAVDGTYYMSILYSSGKEVTFDLSDGEWNGNRKCTIGREGSTGDVRFVVYGAPAPNSKEIASAGEVQLYVIKLELGANSDTLSIYVNPDPSAPEPAEPDASFTVPQLIVNNIRMNCFNTTAVGLLDELRLGETFADVLPVPGAAINIAPADGATGVASTALLEWQVGNDPNEAEGIMPWDEVAGYYVWFGEADPDGDDPNLYLMNVTAQTTTTFNPVIELDKTYYWQIEETFDNGQGGVYSAGDPNNVLGSVWTFESELTIPAITQQPAGVTRAEAGATVELSVTAINATTYEWWYSEDAVVGGDVTVGTGPVLTLTNVGLSDQGYYYCVVSKPGTASVTSTLSQLVINRLLSWYPFENTLDDFAGVNHGTPAGSPMAYTTGIVTADSQAYAADPDGTMYAVLPEGTYPKAGIGNGLERFTYSAWVKVGTGEGGNLMGQFNDGSTTGMRVTLNKGFDISTYVRSETGTAVVADKSGLGIANDEWHLVTITYNGSQVVTYFDGLPVQTNNYSATNFAPWQYPFPLLSINSRGMIGTENFAGGVDDMRIYNYALTAEQVAQMYYDTTGEKVCLYGNPAYDLNGNCIVDLGDLALLAGDWLTHGFYPVD